MTSSLMNSAKKVKFWIHSVLSPRCELPNSISVRVTPTQWLFKTKRSRHEAEKIATVAAPQQVCEAISEKVFQRVFDSSNKGLSLKRQQAYWHFGILYNISSSDDYFSQWLHCLVKCLSPQMHSRHFWCEFLPICPLLAICLHHFSESTVLIVPKS